MLKNIALALSLLFASHQVLAQDASQYVDVKLEVQSNGVDLMKHHGVTIVGYDVHTQKVPNVDRKDLIASRLDYRVESLGTTKDERPFATVTGTIYNEGSNGLWVVQTEFKAAVELGKTGSLTFRNKAGVTTNIGVTIKKADLEALKAKNGGVLPELKQCAGLSDRVREPSEKAQEKLNSQGVEEAARMACCHGVCDTGYHIQCCNVIFCCDYIHGNCCCYT